MSPLDSVSQTFVFADLAGFTALTEAHGDDQAAELAEDFCSRVADLCHKHAAEAVKNIGDAVMVRAGVADEAVALSLALVGETATLKGYPGVRIGMHSGPAKARGGDWIGAAVNVAARVSAAAAAGEVLLSGSTRDALTDPSRFRLEPAGPRSFRNVAKPVQVYRALPSTSEDPAPMAIDPVCRMRIAPGQGVELRFENRRARFCGLECASRYASEPEVYDELAAGL
jgi:adenylate cyclase